MNGEGELRGQPANPGSPGKMSVKMECVSVCVCVCVHWLCLMNICIYSLICPEIIILRLLLCTFHSCCQLCIIFFSSGDNHHSLELDV